MLRKTIGFGLLALVAGCATPPATNVYQPMSARPAPQPQVQSSNGAIYQASSARMNLFEDRRARYVGDTLTVVINEKNAASSNTDKTDSHTASATASMSPNIFGGVGSTNTNLLTAANANKGEDKNQNNNSGTFSGTITVTVVEVLPNGNLIVSGEKQVAVDHKTEYLRLSGVVNPAFITGANVVSSTQIADARVEYKGAESLDKAQMMTMLSRFFLTVLSF